MLAYAKMIWSAIVQAGEVDAVRRYLARRWCWPPEIALLDCVRWLSVPAARIASRRLPAKACGTLVWSFYVAGRAANAPPMSLLSGVQLEALVPDGHRLTAWPSSSSTREAKRLTHGRLRGAYLQLPAPEAAALLVLVRGTRRRPRGLHPGAVVWCCGGRRRQRTKDEAAPTCTNGFSGVSTVRPPGKGNNLGFALLIFFLLAGAGVAHLCRLGIRETGLVVFPLK